MTQKQIESILGEMLIRFPRQEIAPATLRAYAVDLADIPPAQLRAVCQRIWLTEEWFPSIARIRAVWDEMSGPRPFDVETYEKHRKLAVSPSLSHSSHNLRKVS